MHGKEIYKSLENKEILNSFLCAILMQTIKDIKSRIEYQKEDAIIFSRTEFCELICYVAQIDYCLFRKCLNFNLRGMEKDE